MHSEPPPAGLQQDVPLAPLTTIGIGGSARYFLRASSEHAIRDAIAWARGLAIPIFFLGGGSNVLISDSGFEGLVVQVAIDGLEVRREGELVELTAGAGEPWDALVGRTVAEGWAGLECLSGIPGSVGATPIQNVGAYGQEVSETILGVDVLDRGTGEMQRLANEECGFRYRDSRFKRELKNRHVILRVTYRLVAGGAPAIRYPDLERALSSRSGRATLADVREAVIAVRRKKGMVIDPADPDSRSDGSFFMNPILTAPERDRFFERARREGYERDVIPSFPAAGEETKLSAAWLIEKSGFQRGLRHGKVGISSKHTLAIVNRGGGTAAEVIELVRAIRSGVREKFGVELKPEPNFVGFDRLEL